MMASTRIRFWTITALLLGSSCQGWILRPYSVRVSFSRNRQILQCSHSLGTDEVAWKNEGERIILKATEEAGAKPEMIQIEWKSGRVIVTVDGSAYIPAELDLLEDDNIFFEEEDELEFDMGDLDAEFDEEEFTEEEGGEESSMGVDVVAIARAVNSAFDAEGEGSLGYNIAVHHSIEVTTPGATNEVLGIMFESYKGFDVVLEFEDAKTGKTKKVEGKLIEKDEEFTRINERGRMRKFKNELVQSVTLPKAKTEKGNAAKKTSPKKKSNKKKR